MALTAPGDMCACRPWPVDPDMCCEEWPRPWPIPPEVPPEEYTPEQRRALKARAMASEKLWSLTAYQWGLCEDLVRPCGPSDCRPVGYAGSPPSAYLAGGRMYNSACGCACADCELGCTIRLPGPVNEVLEVTLDGRPLVEGVDWIVDSRGGLARLGGCWPHQQDMAAACGEPGSFCVRYLRGLNPESSLHAIRAVSALACSYYQTMCGGSCKSLVGAKRVTRGGVTYETGPSGATGVGPADEWLAMVNPDGRRRMPQVLSLDMRRWIYRGASECAREVTP